MTNRYTDAVVVVTGAAHGIGAACAARLASEGASVALLDLDGDAAIATAASLPGGRAHHSYVLDVTDRASIEEAMAAVEKDCGPIDALINVAGGGILEQPFEESADEAYVRMFDLNLLSVVRVTRAAVPLLRLSERAAVVTVSSVNGLMELGSPAYSSAKAGVHSLTKNLAMRLAPAIRVNAVAPGTTRTRVWDHQQGADRLAVHYPLARVGEPEDIAAAVAFLASGDADWITGQVLAVDGGLSTAGIATFGV